MDEKDKDDHSKCRREYAIQHRLLHHRTTCFCENCSKEQHQWIIRGLSDGSGYNDTWNYLAAHLRHEGPFVLTLDILDAMEKSPLNKYQKGWIMYHCHEPAGGSSVKAAHPRK